MRKTLSFIAIMALLFQVNAQDIQKGNTALINGMEMYYEVYGSGEPLILLHGFFSTSSWWNFVIDDLSKHFKLIIPDLRGHGRSTNPLEHWTMAQSARDIFALMDHLGIEKINGIGVSTGAKTLLHMATQDSIRVTAMILIGGTMYYPDQFREAIRSGLFTIDKVTDEKWKNLRSVHIHGDKQIRKLYRQFNNCAKDYEDMAFTPPLLSIIKAKTLIIHGDCDWAYPVSIAMKIHESIPSSYLWVVPNGSHAPIIGDNTEVFLKISLDFMTKWN
jgi:pimeloyl-ACP methyl ester carboxylesterase